MGFIAHNDADGIISALIFKEYYEYSFKGFYNLKTFYITSDIDLEKDVAIDLDMNCMKSIGHHINPFFNEKSCNPNNKHLKDFYKQYYSKCPLNTVMLLLIKNNIKINNLRQLAIVLFADGFFTYYDKYKENCDNWLNMYKLDYLIDLYNKNRDKVLEIINKEIVPIFSDNCIYNSLKIKIKNGELQNKEVIKKFSEYVIDNFNLHVSPNIFDKNYKIENSYIIKEIPIHNYEEYLKIQNRIKDIHNKETVIISSAMISRQLIKLTMTNDCYIY